MYKLTSFVILMLGIPLLHADVNEGNGIALPTYSTLEMGIARDTYDLNNPSEDDEYLHVVRTVHKIRTALFSLVSGKIEQFHNNVITLPESFPSVSDDPYIEAQVAELMHYAVEADITFADSKVIEFFGEAVSGLTKNKVVSDEQRLSFEASYYYLTNDRENLSHISEQVSGLETSDSFFVCGYVNLLAGKMSLDGEHLETICFLS